MEIILGGDSTVWGYIFAAVIDHLYSTFYHKITGDSLRQWCSQENIDYFRQVIWNKSSYSPCQFERFLNGDTNSFDVLNVPYESFKTFGF